MTKQNFLRTLAILADIYGGDSTLESVDKEIRKCECVSPVTVTATVRAIDKKTSSLDSVSMAPKKRRLHSLVEALVVAEEARNIKLRDLKMDWGINLDMEAGKIYAIDFEVRWARGSYITSTAVFGEGE